MPATYGMNATEQIKVGEPTQRAENQNITAGLPALLKLREVETVLRLSRDGVRALIRDRKLKVFRVGRKSLRVRRADVEKLVTA